MIKLGLPVKRKRLEKKIMEYWDRDPGRVYRAMDKALEDTETKKARMATVRRITQKVCREMYQADPSGFTWLIRKGLFPGFDVGERILYGERGKLKKGVIASIGNIGAFVHSLDNPGLGYAIPGAFIHKLEKNGTDLF